jgi:MFS-type transporter involved in bile tolerance (Atg22 family)
MSDMLISIIGFCGAFFQMIIRGIILTPMGFYISLIAGGTEALAQIGFKTHIGKIVARDELGQVFTLMAIIDASAPIIASSLFTILFKVTIDKFPGTCFLILAFMSLIPIIIAMGIDILRLSQAKRDSVEKKSISNIVIVTKL